jgi:D-alanyl-D-alanine carboxypeptidase (penicillin-binding protein 5/6)
MSYGGSTMFLNTQDRVSVEDLLRGIIVLSGNDACVVIAEALSPDGTEAGFARYMTQRAKQMGMDNSNFANSNGWPAAGHMMSVHDLAVLANRLISDFPEYYPLFAEEEFEFDGRAPSNKRNRNPLLKLGIGADGLKTGHTQEAGYGLVGSAKQGDRRVVFVLTGLDSTARRAEEAEAVVNWSFRNFVERTIADAETPIAEAQIWMGAEKTVGLVPEGDLTLLFPVLNDKDVKAEVVYEGPINAPVEKGQKLAELVITPEGLPEIRRPLFAAKDVPVGGFVVRMKTVGGIVLEDVIGNPLEAM